MQGRHNRPGMEMRSGGRYKALHKAKTYFESRISPTFLKGDTSLGNKERGRRMPVYMNLALDGTTKCRKTALTGECEGSPQCPDRIHLKFSPKHYALKSSLRIFSQIKYN